MGLIIFVIGVTLLAVVVATYLLIRQDAIPPYQDKVDENWPFPSGPKP